MRKVIKCIYICSCATCGRHWEQESSVSECPHCGEGHGCITSTVNREVIEG